MISIIKLTMPETTSNSTSNITSIKTPKLTCIICNKQLSIINNDHKCGYRISNQNIIINK